MRYLVLLVLLFPLVAFSTGCTGEKTLPPKKDPNWVDTSDPSKIVIPDEMKKGAKK